MGLFAEAAAYHEVLADDFPRASTPRTPRTTPCSCARPSATTTRRSPTANATASSIRPAPDADEVTFLMGKAHERAKKWRDAGELYRTTPRRAKNADRKPRPTCGSPRCASSTNNNRTRTTRSATRSRSASRRAHPRPRRQVRRRARALHAGRAHPRGLRADRDRRRHEAAHRAAQAEDRALADRRPTCFSMREMGVAEWTTAALYQIGHTYESFAGALRNSPPPSNLSDADKEAYQQQIDEFVVPIEEKSLEAYESGWKKAVELGIFNSWTAKMREALGRLNSELYPPLKEIGFEIRSSAPAPLPPLIGAPRRGGRRRRKRLLPQRPSVGGQEVKLAAACWRSRCSSRRLRRSAEKKKPCRRRTAPCGPAGRRQDGLGRGVRQEPERARARHRAHARGDRHRSAISGRRTTISACCSRREAISPAPSRRSERAPKLAPDAEEIATALGAGAQAARRAEESGRRAAGLRRAAPRRQGRARALRRGAARLGADRRRHRAGARGAAPPRGRRDGALGARARRARQGRARLRRAAGEGGDREQQGQRRRPPHRRAHRARQGRRRRGVRVVRQSVAARSEGHHRAAQHGTVLLRAGVYPKAGEQFRAVLKDRRTTTTRRSGSRPRCAGRATRITPRSSPRRRRCWKACSRAIRTTSRRSSISPCCSPIS